MTEYRYVVVEPVCEVHVIAKVVGERKNAIVLCSRTKATKYNARLTVEDWDKMPHTPQEAEEAWISGLLRGLEHCRNSVQMKEEELTKARALVGKLEVKDLR